MSIRAILLAFVASTLIFQGCAFGPHKQYDSQKALGLFNKGDIDGGFKYLERSMEIDPDRLEISNLYRQMAVKNKRQDYAIEYFKSQVEKPNVAEAMRYNLAFAYIDKIPTVGPMGSGFLSKKAIAQFQHVLDQDPDDWIATYGIGMNYLHWPDYFKKNGSAVEYLERAKILQSGKSPKPYHILTYIRLGDAYAKIGEIEKAYSIWSEGIDQFPNHKDLSDRLNTSRNEIGQAILAVYNPNNSIGEINTDISVLWEGTVPVVLVPLAKNPLRQGGVGGQLSSVDSGSGGANIGLFSWFMRNLPFLSDKTQSANVDMSALGIGSENGTGDLASIVAHGMILGFMSQFEEESATQARAKAGTLSPFHRPFFHEGLGMGYAATASLDDPAELKKLINRLKEIDPHYTRLHLAGAGMWYGLESNNLEKVKKVFPLLGDFGEAYAYEGYGFALTLFYYKNNPEILRVGDDLSLSAASSFYHGAGRALWILTGSDTSALEGGIGRIPEPYRSNAYSGYGMGVTFTKIDTPDFIISQLKRVQNTVDSGQFFTGLTMGLTIRNLSDPDYVHKMLALSDPAEQCGFNQALTVGDETLDLLNKGGESDLHLNWRDRIHHHVSHVETIEEWSVCK